MSSLLDLLQYYGAGINDANANDYHLLFVGASAQKLRFLRVITDLDQ